jgi:hypothetical protein
VFALIQGVEPEEGVHMAAVRVHRYTVDPADLEELLARRA